jgi:hypothetical protein
MPQTSGTAEALGQTLNAIAASGVGVAFDVIHALGSILPGTGQHNAVPDAAQGARAKTRRGGRVW